MHCGKNDDVESNKRQLHHLLELATSQLMGFTLVRDSIQYHHFSPLILTWYSGAKVADHSFLWRDLDRGYAHLTTVPHAQISFISEPQLSYLTSSLPSRSRLKQTESSKTSSYKRYTFHKFKLVFKSGCYS